MKKTDFQKLPGWLQSNVFYRTNLQQDSSEEQNFSKTGKEVHPLDANLISSEKANGRHVLMLDLDQQTYIADSSSPRHKHVYIDADLSLEALQEIIGVLAKHGIVQNGIKKQVDVGKCLTMRPPGIKKGNPQDDAGIEKYKHLLKESVSTTESNWFPNAGLLFKFESAPPPYFQAYKGQLSNMQMINLNIPKEAEGFFFNGLAKKLNFDISDITFNTNPGSNYKNAYDYDLRLKGFKLATGHYNAMADAYMISFNQKDFINKPIPAWPDWGQVVKSLNELGAV